MHTTQTVIERMIKHLHDPPVSIEENNAKSLDRRSKQAFINRTEIIDAVILSENALGFEGMKGDAIKELQPGGKSPHQYFAWSERCGAGDRIVG